MELIRKQTYITPEQDAALKRIAAQQRRSEADLLRQALDEWLRGNAEDNQLNPFDAFTGWFDGSEMNDHNDIYR